MTLITTSIALLHIAFGATTVPVALEPVRVTEQAPPTSRHPGSDAVAGAGGTALTPSLFRIVPSAVATSDPRLYRRDI